MLVPISWSSYFLGAAILLGCYYSGVAAFFYRPEINTWLNRNKASSQANTVTQAAEDMSDPSSFGKLEQLVHEIDGILEQAGTNATKDQLLAELIPKLASFGGLRHPAYRVAILKHITAKAEEICGIGIRSEELDQVMQ